MTEMARRNRATGYIGPNGELDPFCNEDGTDPETGRQEYPFVDPDEVARRKALPFPAGEPRPDVNKLRLPLAPEPSDEPYIDMSEGDPVVESYPKTPEPKKKPERMAKEDFEAEIAERYRAFVDSTAEARALRELQGRRTDPRMRPTVSALRASVEELSVALTMEEPDVTALLVRIVHTASMGILVSSEVRDGRG